MLALHYRDEAGHLSSRDIQIAGIVFRGEHRLLVARCETEDYRCFRLDRCLQITRLTGDFVKQSTVLLRDFLRKVVEHEKCRKMIAIPLTLVKRLIGHQFA